MKIESLLPFLFLFAFKQVSICVADQLERKREKSSDATVHGENQDVVTHIEAKFRTKHWSYSNSSKKKEEGSLKFENLTGNIRHLDVAASYQESSDKERKLSANDDGLQICAAGESEVVVYIDPDDCYYYQTSWKIFNAGTSNVVASVGREVFFHQFPNIRTVCLPSGDYTLTIFDSGGDGWLDGFFFVSVNGVKKFIVHGYDFGQSISRDFTVSKTPEPTKEPKATKTTKAPKGSKAPKSTTAAPLSGNNYAIGDVIFSEPDGLFPCDSSRRLNSMI